MQPKKASRTAYKIAMGIITLGTKSSMNQILPDGIVAATATLLVKSGLAGERLVKCASSKKIVALFEAFDWMLPGQFAALGHRKAFFEQQVRWAIDKGITQILVLGAGYDTLGWRLAREFGQEVHFFEIDQPATAAIKAAGITEMGHPKNLHLLAEDLAKKQLSTVLECNAQWDQNAKSIFIAEGLAMYLTAAAVYDLFSQCAAFSGKSSYIAFSYIPKGPDGRPDAGKWTGLILWILKMAGEPWLSSIEADRIGSFLEKTGWISLPAHTDTGTNPNTKLKHGVEYFEFAGKLNSKPSAKIIKPGNAK